MKLGFLPFIFLSASAHYAVLNHGMSLPLEINQGGEQGRSDFAIEIIHTKIADKPVNTPAEENSRNSADKPLTKHVTKEVVTIKKTMPATPPAHKPLQQTATAAEKQVELTDYADVADEKPDSDKNIVIQSTIRQLLKDELDKYFYYPKAAVRRNWQGNLTVSFVIHQDGSIDNIRISESSGYDILDNAAMNSVSQFKLSASHNLLSLVDSTETTLPVKYILN